MPMQFLTVSIPQSDISTPAFQNDLIHGPLVLILHDKIVAMYTHFDIAVPT
ncbi:hypothetical protein [Staphylococcus schleiferi]|nr:hypothetical protein [Staphylococcus schleiferi]